MKKTKGIPTTFRLIAQAARLWWEDWVNGVLVSLAMILTSLTVLLVGPALLGVCVVAADLVKGMRTGIAGWWNGFKQYFWQGLIWGMVNLVLMFIFGTGLWFYTRLESPWAHLLVWVLFSMALFWGSMQFYTPGYLIAQVDKSLWLAWKNSFFTVLAAPGMTVVLGGLGLIIMVASLGLLLPTFLGTGVLLGLFSVLAVNNRLEVYQGKQNEHHS